MWSGLRTLALVTVLACGAGNAGAATLSLNFTTTRAFWDRNDEEWGTMPLINWSGSFSYDETAGIAMARPINHFYAAYPVKFGFTADSEFSKLDNLGSFNPVTGAFSALSFESPEWIDGIVLRLTSTSPTSGTYIASGYNADPNLGFGVVGTYSLTELPLATVPGPIAGAGLPALLALGGFVWARRRKAAFPCRGLI